ncbi:Gfo/Idh/MocA family protein [Microbacterium sp. ZW T5_56]|uniref:Gfo/Idh/MocA family protein n=1 Tax=Microbacterium sp. ZW T5_56 TaxID=3378081 RepID=UPI0038534AAE
MRWGIIGTGDISDRVAADLIATGGEIRAVWGRTLPRADAFASRHDIAVATTSRESLFERADVDIVYVATPAHTHAEIVREALDAGKHVLVEKPIATSASDAHELFARAHAAGRFLMEAMWMRFNPLYVEMIDRVASGELGGISSVRASFGTPFHPRPGKTRPQDGGSILRDRGIYPVTLAHWFLGAPSDVHAHAAIVDGVDVDGRAEFDYGEAFAHLAWSGTRFLDLSAAVSGERGWITLEPMFWAGTRARVHAGSAERIFADPELVQHRREGNGYGPMLRAVTTAVQDGALEHPWHNAAATISIARSLDWILTASRR